MYVLEGQVTYLPTTSSAAYIDAPNAASTQTYAPMLKLEGQHEPPDHAPPAEYWGKSKLISTFPKLPMYVEASRLEAASGICVNIRRIVILLPPMISVSSEIQLVSWNQGKQLARRRSGIHREVGDHLYTSNSQLMGKMGTQYRSWEWERYIPCLPGLLHLSRLQWTR